MTRKKTDRMIVYVVILVGIVLSAYAIGLSTWDDPSAEWGEISKNVAGSLAYLFMVGMCLAGVIKARELKSHAGTFATIIVFTFLGIVLSGFLTYIGVNVIGGFETDYLNQVRSLVIIFCVFLGVIFAFIDRS